MDINYFEQVWSKKKTDKTACQSFWDGRAEEFNIKKQKNGGDKRLNNVLELFASKGMLKEDGNVLDVGCGPGKYSVEFAKQTKSVIGTDISPKMIEFARENAQAEGLNNASFDTLDWEMADLKALGWEKKFDLVFASMTPAINSKNTLEKMVNASKGFCFVSTFVDRKDSVRDCLSSLIDWQTTNRDFSKTIYCGFNILWLMGFHPEITYLDTEWENAYSLEKAVSMYTSHFEMTQSLSKEQKADISDYLGKISENGQVKEKIDAKIAWMYWKI